MTEILFILFGIFTIACGAGVVLAKSPVYSAFSLILSFFGLSALYVLFGATFIGMIQILVYTGAIVVLFVFVVMLLNLGKATTHFHNWLVMAVAGGAAWFFSLVLLRVLTKGVFAAGQNAPAENNIRVISKLLFTQYLWPFEVLSLFLLVLMVAIFALARPEEGSPT